MFLPLHDDNPLRVIAFQRTTFALILINVLTFGWQIWLGEEGLAAAYSGGFIPAALLDAQFDSVAAALPAGWEYMPAWTTLLTYMFLHADIWHLAGNMLFLWVFGDNVEDATGHLRFLVFYLLCGVAAGLAHAGMHPADSVPLIGASGATSGVIGAYLLLHPKVRVWVLVLMRVPLRLPALWVLLAWLAMQVAFVAIGDQSGTAWWAHLGGFAAGLVLIPVFKRAGVPLFDRGRAAAA